LVLCNEPACTIRTTRGASLGISSGKKFLDTRDPKAEDGDGATTQRAGETGTFLPRRRLRKVAEMPEVDPKSTSLL